MTTHPPRAEWDSASAQRKRGKMSPSVTSSMVIVAGRLVRSHQERSAVPSPSRRLMVGRPVGRCCFASVSCSLVRNDILPLHIHRMRRLPHSSDVHVQMVDPSRSVVTPPGLDRAVTTRTRASNALIQR